MEHQKASKKSSKRHNKSQYTDGGAGEQPAALNDKGTHLIERLDLTAFKVNKCSVKSAHSFRKCIYYHNESDRRRDPTFSYYSSDLCKFIETEGSCKFGDKCQYSHSKAEQGYHPEKYRKKFCSYYKERVHQCPYAKFCSYAHSEEEVQTTLIHNYLRDADFYMFHFKTDFCPYSNEHDRARCVYAHNWQDYRRDPSKYTYSPVLCRNWNRTKKISSYDQGCPKKFDCQDCHGRNHLPQDGKS